FSIVFQRVETLIIGTALSFFIYIYLHEQLLANFKPFGGYANWVTIFRFLLMLTGGVLLNSWNPVYCFPFFLIALCLDGLDGYLARKLGQTTEFGAYLDMETDAFFVAFLSTYWYLDGRVGVWILFIGFLRYLYVLTLKLSGLEGKEEKGTRFAKIIAVLIMSALLAPFVLPEMVYMSMIVLASVLTVYSFGVSFVSRLQSR
ncbi:MAG: CDP-alcohol phosphatidyltransferase family protein, partial [Bacteroidetes bacterium]